jgi:hypothetical protein
MALKRTSNELLTTFEMLHFLMPIVTPNYNDWSKLMGALLATHHTVLKYDLNVHMR